jgi:hypothetical protein
MEILRWALAVPFWLEMNGPVCDATKTRGVKWITLVQRFREHGCD